MGRHLCFLCSGALASIGDVENCWKARKTGAALLENNLDVIFLLRKLLQMPVIQLECQLKECGDNPESWISLCDQCTQLIRKGRELDEEIQKIERRLRLIKNQVLSKIRTGCPGTTDDKKEDEDGYLGLGDSSGDFESKIRFYAKNCQFNQLDEERDASEIIEGDKLADYLESQGNNCSAAILLVENRPCEDYQDEIKVEEESPPMSPTPLESPDDSVTDNEDDPSYDPEQEPEEPDENVGKPGIDNHSCSVCGRDFNALRYLSRHLREAHNTRFHITCPLCPEVSFQCKRYLHRHLLGKHKDEPVTKKLKEETGLFLRKCSVVGCVASFMKQELEDRHMEMVHGGRRAEDHKTDKRYKCKYCERGFWDNHKCRRHEKIHEEKGKVRQVTWNTARKGVTRTPTTRIRIRITKGNPNNKFKCDHCSKSFKYARKWSDHLWNTHDKQDISCPGLECGITFKDDLAVFQKHWKSSHVPKRDRIDGQKHVCSFCGKEFERQFYLNRHQKNQHLTNPGEKFICEICGVEKKSAEYLYQHKYHMHKKKTTVKSPVEGQFICGICGNELGSQKSLLHHKRTIHRPGRQDQPLKPNRKKGEKSMLMGIKIVCNICGKEYSSENNLKLHVKYVHDKQYEFSCHVCGLKYANKSQMRMHLLTIHKEDPVTRKLEEEEGLSVRKCQVVGCIAMFLKQEALDKHVEKMHPDGGNGEEISKRFQCKYCGKGFGVGQRLKRHERIHEGEGREDFRCEICGKGFSTPDYLDYHLKLTHKQAKKFLKNNAE